MTEFEQDLLIELFEAGGTPRTAWQEVQCTQRKLDRIIKSWCGRGLYSFGTEEDMGWLTPDGKKFAQRLITQREAA